MKGNRKVIQHRNRQRIPGLTAFSRCFRHARRLAEHVPVREGFSSPQPADARH